MAKTDVSEQQMRSFLEAMFPDIIEYDKDGNEVERRTSPQALTSRTEIEALFKGDSEGVGSIGETAWDLYNAVAYYVDHSRRRSKKQREWGISRFETSIFGTGSDLREKAFHWLKPKKGEE
jgi:hypothetical protein